MTASTTFTWAINTMERTTADGVVFTVHYTVNAEDGTYSAGAYGSVGLEQPDPSALIPYANLTPELVIGWVKDKLGAEAATNVETALQGQLDEQRAPSKAQGVPWAA